MVKQSLPNFTDLLILEMVRRGTWSRQYVAEFTCSPLWYVNRLCYRHGATSGPARRGQTRRSQSDARRLSSVFGGVRRKRSVA